MKIIFYFQDKKAQATVELAVMFPIIIIIAVIAVNSLTFFSQCSSFDRTFKQIVSLIGPNPGYGKDIQNTKSLIESELSNSFDNEYLEFDVSVENVNNGYQAFYGTLKMQPTLFGMGLRSEIFGVALPKLTHQQKLIVEIYKPGVIF